SAIAEHDPVTTLRTAGLTDWCTVAYSAVLASLVGHGLFFFLVQRHPVSSIMPYLQMTPILAVLFGVILWGDRPGWHLLAGGALVMTGIVLITIRARARLSVRLGKNNRDAV
ncbi:MAG: DMT family transporter, partial [Lysobacterales bacterium]